MAHSLSTQTKPGVPLNRIWLQAGALDFVREELSDYGRADGDFKSVVVRFAFPRRAWERGKAYVLNDILEFLRRERMI